MCSRFNLRLQNTCTMIEEFVYHWSQQIVATFLHHWSNGQIGFNFLALFCSRKSQGAMVLSIKWWWTAWWIIFLVLSKLPSFLDAKITKYKIEYTKWKIQIEIQMCDHHVSAKGQRFARERRDLRESEPEMCNLLMTWFHMQNHPHIFCTKSTSAAKHYYNVWNTQHMI